MAAFQTMKAELTIKSVALLSGISAHTLRAWERRHKAISPRRTVTGRRVYALSDVERLKLIGRLIDGGHSIGSIARLAKEELEELVSKLPSTHLPRQPLVKSSSPRPILGGAVEIRDAVLKALQRLDLDRIDRELARARLNFSAATIALEVFSPLMAEVGKRVDRGVLGIAEEHTLSALLRDHLGLMLQTARQCAMSQGVKVLITTQEGNQHEFGILLAAILCSSRGFDVHYLGPSMPASEIVRIARLTTPAALILGTTALPPDWQGDSFEVFSRKLLEDLPKAAEIWLGGAIGFDPSSLKTRRTIRHLETLTKLDQLLVEFQRREH